MESSREATVAPVIALRPAWRSSPWSGLGGVMALGLGLRLWRLDQNGYGTEYYSAGVRSMMDSRHNFLFNSFDPAGFVSLDKPPVALWILAHLGRWPAPARPGPAPPHGPFLSGSGPPRIAAR